MNYYITPTGSDNNSGSATSPWFTLTRAWRSVQPGDTFYLGGGDYFYKNQQNLTGRNGSVNSLIKVFAAPGEIPRFSPDSAYASGDQDLIFFNGAWVHFRGVEIANFKHSQGYNAFRSQDADNCTFELFDVHHNVSGMAIRGDSTNNLVLNSDFHHNVNLNDYGGTDGLNISLIPLASAKNTVRGCRAWYNSDDGIDFWGNEGYVLIEDSWSWNNGYLEGGLTPAGDGGGFKLGETKSYPGVLKRTVKNCIAYKNRNWGFIENNLPANIELVNNTAVSNGQWNYAFGWWGNSKTTLQNNISYKAGGKDGRQDQLEPGKVIETNNSWQGKTITDADFESITGTELGASRKADGSLPDIKFLRPVAGSDLVGLGALSASIGTTQPPPITDTVIKSSVVYYDNGTTIKRLAASSFTKRSDGYYVGSTKRDIVFYKDEKGKWVTL